MPMNPRLLRPLARRQAPAPAPSDPYFSQVKLLLHMDGADASTTFTDSSSSARTVTANGDAQIDTSAFVFGGASGYFDGAGDYLSLQMPFDWGADFTVEMWVQFAGTSGSVFAAGNIQSGVGGLHIEAANGIFYFNDAQAGAISGGSVTTDQWQHIAAVRQSGQNALYVDGVLIGTSNQTFPVLNNTVTIAGAPNYSNYFSRNVDEVRVTQHARYTANFTAPTAPFPNQ